MAKMLGAPLPLNADQWEEAERANRSGLVMLPPDKLKHIEGANCEISEGVDALKDLFWGYESAERKKKRHAWKRRQNERARREKKGLPPPKPEENFDSATDHMPATDEETDPELRSDLDTSAEGDEDMESSEKKKENVQTVWTTRRVDTWYISDKEDNDDDDDDDGSYDGDDSDEEMANCNDNNNDGGDDDNNNDADDNGDCIRGLDVPESSCILPQQVRIQIGAFFAKHPVTLEMCHQHVAAVLEKQVVVRSADVQFGDGCYTCYVDNTDRDAEGTMTLVQFLEQDLDHSRLAMAAELYGSLVPSFQALGTFGPGPGPLHVWKLVCPRGVPLGRALDELDLCPVEEDEADWDEDDDDLARLANMVTDVVKFVIRGKLEAHEVQALGGMDFRKQLFELYKEKLAYVQRSMEIMDDDALLDLSPAPDTREILPSLMSLVESLVAHNVNADEDEDEASAASPWPLSLHNPNLTTTSILVRPDRTGVACVLDWRATSIMPLYIGMARVQALLGELPHTQELQRHALLELQAAAAALASCPAAAPPANMLMQAQAVGHLLEYANIAAGEDGAGADNDHDHDRHRHHVRRCFEAMQRRVSECHLLLWEIQHFGLEFAATPKPRVRAIEGGKAETEPGLVLNTAHKRTRSSTCIGAEMWGGQKRPKRAGSGPSGRGGPEKEQDGGDGDRIYHATGHHCWLSQ